MLLVILKVKKLLKGFAKMNFKKQIKNSLGLKKKKKKRKKCYKLYIKWKGFNNSFNSWIDKKNVVKMGEYFSGWKSLGGRVKVELDFFNDVAKADLKNATGVHTAKFTKTE